jgi:hypothetical protein
MLNAFAAQKGSAAMPTEQLGSWMYLLQIAEQGNAL